MTIKKLLPLLILPLLVAGCESKSDRRKHLCAGWTLERYPSKETKNKIVEEFGLKDYPEDKNLYSPVRNACKFYRN